MRVSFYKALTLVAMAACLGTQEVVEAVQLSSQSQTYQDTPAKAEEPTKAEGAEAGEMDKPVVDEAR